MTIKSNPRFLGLAKLCPVLAVALLLISVPVLADWIPSDGHKMHWPQLPDEQGWDVNATNPVILADDWLCTGSGPVTDIHFWGSWRDMNGDGQGDVGQIVSFTLSIHEDIPAVPGSVPYSRPGETLWEVTVDSWSALPIDPPTLEAWLDPSMEPDFVVPNDHDSYFQYNVDLVGQGITPWVQVEGTIYWLNISATLAAGQNAQWGWKSTIDHWNDDAVWATWGDLSWIDIIEPPRYNEFNIWLDPGGMFVAGGGTNYYTDGNDQQGWYHYEETGWWNIWFYDNPFTTDNFKQATVMGNVLPLEATASSQVVIAVNWSTDAWSDGTTGRPPLPSDPNENQNIGREIIFTWDPQTQGPLPPTGVPLEEFWELAEYNPEWISIDVQGFNFVFVGNIVHECVTTSLDLAFVINGPSDPTGACCWPNGSCTIETQSDCVNGPAAPGTYLGDGVPCQGDVNPQNGVDDACETPPATGACCFQDGTCQGGLSAADCAAQGGSYLGDGTACLGDNNGDGIDDACGGAVVQGACCLRDGSCVGTTAGWCNTLGGTYLGDNSVCLGDADGNGVDDACETPAKKGACCWQDGTCSVVTAAKCVKNGGTYLGDNTACQGDGDGNGVDDACETPDPDFKWEQLPDIDSTGFDVNATFNDAEPYILADDFECTITGPITRIHVYGSWVVDFLPPEGPGDVNFVLSIHRDVPVNPSDPNSFSHPGELVCLLPDLPFEVRPYATDLEEGWFNPPHEYYPVGDRVCWEYIFYLPPDVCFQEGTMSNPVVYWLDLQAYPNFDPGLDLRPTFGWKSSLDHWNDDATWAWGQDDAAASLGWEELIYPADHLFAGESVDLAFKIIGHDGTPRTGACCWPDGSCSIETKANCESSPFGIGGNYQGDGTSCQGDNNNNGIDDACENVLPIGACCYNDPGAGPTCVNTTHSNCVKNLGGNWYPGQDCNDPNFTCPNQPPQGACCYEDAAGNMNCVNTTQSQCVGQYGGTWYLGKDCATWDCPTPQPIGACCYGPPASPSCVNTTQDQCKTVYNGTWYPGQDCASFDCPTVAPSGACCFDDPATGPSCVNAAQAVCLQVYGGTWYAGQDCASFDCPNQPPTGACCYGDPANPTCINTTHSDCLANYGGTWYLGKDCATWDCPVPVELGACCYGDPANPSCVDNISQYECKTFFGGNWYPGQTCASIDCPTSVPAGACCYDDPVNGPTCVITSKKDCLKAYGGTWYMGQNCADIDCDNNQPPQGACCYVDATGVMSCLQTTHSDCIANYGGTWYLGQTCADIDCPTPHDLGACCYGDPANPSCVDGVTQLICEAQFGGSWYAGQTCTSIDCPSVLEPTGACCYDVAGAGQACVNTTQPDCIRNYGGTWYAGQDCASFDCPNQPPRGACCYGDPANPSCVNTTEADCLSALGGTWYANTSCVDFDCPVPPDSGACCYEDAAGNESCVNTTQKDCKAVYGGTWYANMDCDTFDCPDPEPTGACCYGDPPLCVNTTEDQCKSAYGGTWYAGQNCATFTCPPSQPTGACCWPDGSCTIENKTACESAATPGTYLGDGSLCIGDLDGNGVDDACEDPKPSWKWLQPPDLNPTGVDVRLTDPVILADDFLCTWPGDIKEISIWASWLNDEFPTGGSPADVSFVLSIHTDVPSISTGVPVTDCPLGGSGLDILGGLPPQTAIRGHARLTEFANMNTDDGGSLGGSIVTFDAILDLQLTNDGVPGFGDRHLFVPIQCEVHTGPRQPGDPVQSFDTEMIQLQGELFGDPDFCTLRIQAGKNFGLPSPGQTTLTKLGDGTFQVDSFFDIFYEIEFEGCPGSAIENMLGSTTGHVRVENPEPGGGDCTTPDLGQWSYPGELICLKTIDRGDFNWEEVPVTEEDWFDPLENIYLSPGDHNCIKYTFNFDPGECVQEGTLTDPIVYWLDVQAFVAEDNVHIGWKTSNVHWNDDATWNVGQDPVTSPWLELWYPQEHQFHPRSLDLAFQVVGPPGTCCIGITGNIDGDPQEIIDLGDLTALIDYLFISFTRPDCIEEANVDGDQTGVVDLGDLTALIDYLFISFTPPAPCQ